MKKIILILTILTIVNCNIHSTAKTEMKEHVFLLEDKDDSKFYLVGPVKEAYKKGSFTNSPIIAIDGIVFKYNRSLDTVNLPLKRENITNLSLLDRNSSPVIYGKRETNGAIIINTSK